MRKISRQYVHLSIDYETAYNVGKRHGKPYIIKVESGKMYDNGHVFYLSKNTAWLSEDINSEYLIFE